LKIFQQMDISNPDAQVNASDQACFLF